jgi:hypothetical protein
VLELLRIVEALKGDPRRVFREFWSGVAAKDLRRRKLWLFGSTTSTFSTCSLESLVAD